MFFDRLEVHEAIIDSGVGYQILHSRWQECCGIQHPVTSIRHPIRVATSSVGQSHLVGKLTSAYSPGVSSSSSNSRSISSIWTISQASLSVGVTFIISN